MPLQSRQHRPFVDDAPVQADSEWLDAQRCETRPMQTGPLSWPEIDQLGVHLNGAYGVVNQPL